MADFFDEMRSIHHDIAAGIRSTTPVQWVRDGIYSIGLGSFTFTVCEGPHILFDPVPAAPLITAIIGTVGGPVISEVLVLKHRGYENLRDEIDDCEGSTIIEGICRRIPDNSSQSDGNNISYLTPR